MTKPLAQAERRAAPKPAAQRQQPSTGGLLSDFAPSGDRPTSPSDEGFQFLCRLDELPDGGSRGLLRRGLDDQLCVVRQGEEVFIWLNDCPHEHRPMEYRQDKFLSGDGGHIVCYAHSAHFDVRTGHCFAGPCTGQYLTPVPARVENGEIWIPAELPTIFD